MTAREVLLDGGSPWGFRMTGGADVGHPLRISRVNPGSKASQKGVREGDVITSINGQSTKCLTNGDSHTLLRTAGNALRLGLNEDTVSSPKRKNKDYSKRDTAGSSTQSVNSTPAVAPSSSVTEVPADPVTSPTNGKGKKSKFRLNLDKPKPEPEMVNTETPSKASGMSSSKARRLRKARVNSRKKNGEEPEEVTRINDVKSDSIKTDVNDDNKDNARISGSVESEDKNEVEILVVVDSVHVVPEEAVTQLPDDAVEEADEVNNWLNNNKPKETTMSHENRTLDIINHSENMNNNSALSDFDLLSNVGGVDKQKETVKSHDKASDVVSTKSVQHNTNCSSETVNKSDTFIVKEIILPERVEVILPERISKDDTENSRSFSTPSHDCTLCKERNVSNGKKVSFAKSVFENVVNESVQSNQLLTCKLSVLPTQQTLSPPVESNLTEEANEAALKQIPVSVYVHSPENDISAVRLSWDSESTSSHQFSSDDEINSDMLIYLPSNERTSLKILQDVPGGEEGGYDLSVSDIRDPLIKPEEEKQLRQFLKTLDLTRPEEFDDSSSSKSHDESGVTSGSETDSVKEEIVVYKHIRSRCLPETCYIPVDRRRHLEVITEEGSDPSDGERKPWENPMVIRQNNEIEGIPNDWYGSDEDNMGTSDEDGIDTSWGGGTKLEDVEGVEIVYLADNSEEDDEIMKRTFEESKRNNSLVQPELVVIHEVHIDDKRNIVEMCDVDEDEERKSKVQEIIDILNNTYDINKDILNTNELIKNNDENVNIREKIENCSTTFNMMDEDDSKTSSLSETCSNASTTDDLIQIESKDIKDLDCPLPQEKIDATTPPPTFSRQGSTSSGTGSQSTAKYYPGQSPMSSESEDKTENDVNECHRKKKFIQNPKSLKRLSEQAVISLPKGNYILEQIGFYSQDKPFQLLNEGYKLSHLPPSGISTRRSSSNHELEAINFQPIPTKNSPVNSPPRSIILVSSPPPSCFAKSPPPLEENQWVGMPTSIDPNVMVCLSPLQSKAKSLPTPKEASELLDLHKKFIERRGYHEQEKRQSSVTKESSDSPDVVRVDSQCSDKSGFYTPELLTEAANLLALNQYRQSRFKSDCSGWEKNDIENNNDKEGDVEVEEKWNELEALRNDDSKVEQLAKSFESFNNGSGIINNLMRSAELFNMLKENRKSSFTNTTNMKDRCKNNLNTDAEHNYTQNDKDIKAGVCVGMTSSCTEINEHLVDPHVNRSTSTSRLLAIIQNTDSSCKDLRNNTVPSEMNGDENSAVKTESDRKFIRSDFISNWLTMSQNVESQVNGVGNDDGERRHFETERYKISKQGDIAVHSSENMLRRDRPRSLPAIHSPPPTGGEVFRQKMYEEYMDKVAERSERRQNKVIKISNRPVSMYSKLEENDTAFVDSHKLENEFMGRVKERMNKLGLEMDDEVEEDIIKEEQPQLPSDVHVRLGDEEADVNNLPKHLQEFLELTLAPPVETEETSGVWSPVGTPEAQRKEFNFKEVQKEESERKKSESESEPGPAVWTPKSAGASPTLEKKTFRTVSFESPKPARKVYNQQSFQEEVKPPTDLPIEWKKGPDTSYTSRTVTNREDNTQSRLVTSHSAPDTSFAATESKLPRSQNPTITLLQKAREGQLPRGAHYLEADAVNRDRDNKSPTAYPNEIIYSIRKEYESETEDKKPKKIVELGPRKFEGIGPTTKEGIPTVLRSEVKDVNQQKWYKRMYDSLHKTEKDKDSVTIRYKTPQRGRYPYTSPGGYLSEPEHLGGGYDSDYISSKYATLDRRRIRNKENDYPSSTMPRNKGYGNAVKHAVGVYKNQPGRIEDYEPGNSSIAEKETKQWWDEVMDIFDGQFEQTKKTSQYPQNITTTRNTKPYMTYALKESGYESDSTLLFKRRDEQHQQLSPAEHKTIYKTIQKGGEVPLHGLRKPAPERPKEPNMGRPISTNLRENYAKDRQPESPHRYVESEVTIHYRSPVRAEEKEAWSEEELQRRQAEAMRRIYQEERRRKYLQELQDMYSRRHTDNFTPSQKSPIPLNRYDDFLDDVPPTKPRDRTPEPKLVARALYNFMGQTSRELSFRRGDIIYVRRQIDKNWYEGEHNAMIGLFPFNYVEIIPYDGIRTVPKKASEGQARAKFNFQAQTHLELPLVKGELVLLTRRVDENWFEGRIGNRKGIFPVSYVDVLVEPGEREVSPVIVSPSNVKPVASPASHSLHVSNNMSQHHYQPPRPVSYTSLPKMKQVKPDPPPVNQTLHIDTQNEPVPYRVLYNYKPQNEDELELNEGETVYVMEKCDDGWYVGSSQRTGYLGTFPGNYVERIA